jgi:hypothetical protein
MKFIMESFLNKRDENALSFIYIGKVSSTKMTAAASVTVTTTVNDYYRDCDYNCDCDYYCDWL